MMETLFRLLVYAVSAWVSQKYANGAWVVGPVFGMAVISYDAKALKDRDWARHAAFGVASTLIYALVYRISRLDWGNGSDLFEYFLGSLPAGVVTGSILLPVAHAVLFKKSAALAARVSVSLVLSFYLVTLLGYWDDKAGLGWDIQWLAVMVAVWQGVYLYLFFRRA